MAGGIRSPGFLLPRAGRGSEPLPPAPLLCYKDAMTDLGEFKRYKIGDAAKLLEVKPYVLRFWESEFPQLEPIRTPSGQRLYTDEHLDLLRRIKALLYGEGLTIEGAVKRLNGDTPLDFLHEVAEDLEDILRLLKAGPDNRDEESTPYESD